MADGRVSFSVEAVVRGYHAYKDIWAAVYDEELPCEREAGNRVDAFAMAIMKDGMVVGHIPKKISSILLFVPMSRRIHYMSCNGIKMLLWRPKNFHDKVSKFLRFLFSCFGRGSRKSQKFGPRENFPLYSIQQ